MTWALRYHNNDGCYSLWHTIQTVSLSSSTTTSNLQLVCPKEMVLIYCSTNGAGLLWGLPMETNNLVSFYTDDTTSPIQRRGSITLWRDSIQPLSSHIEIPYSPELSDTNITCESGGERQSQLYKLAGKYASHLYSIAACSLIPQAGKPFSV